MKMKLTTTILSAISAWMLCVSQPLSADWCDGQKYLISKMPMSERIADAGIALQSSMQQISSSVNQLQLDLQRTVRHNKQVINQQILELSAETRMLCLSAVQGKYPLRYQNIKLYNILELHARIKLNLQLLQAHQAALTQAQQQQKNMDMLTNTLQQKRATLAVLLRQLQEQADQSRLAAFAEQYVQSVCLSVDESTQRLNEAGQLNVDALLMDSRLPQHNNTVSDSKLEHYLQHCRLEQVSAIESINQADLQMEVDIQGSQNNMQWLQQLIDKTKGWL